MTVSEYASRDAADDRGASESVESNGAEPRRRRRHWTTIVLESYGEGWRATQTGVDIEGHGATAAAAAAAYCRRIAETGERAAAECGSDDSENVRETVGRQDG